MADEPGFGLLSMMSQSSPPAAPNAQSLLDLMQAQPQAGWQSDPNLNAGAPYRPITSPGDQNWSDLAGNPIHMGGPPPAYRETGNEGIFPSIFNPGAAPTGWFNLDDYYKGAPAQADNPAAQNVPQNFAGGSNMLSTNDWRLLPSQYRNPNYFQINGDIIDRNLGRVELSPGGHGSYLGAEAGPVSTDVNRGSLGVGGRPRVYWNGWNARSAFPGQLGGQSQWSTSSY